MRCGPLCCGACLASLRMPRPGSAEHYRPAPRLRHRPQRPEPVGCSCCCRPPSRPASACGSWRGGRRRPTCSSGGGARRGQGSSGSLAASRPRLPCPLIIPPFCYPNPARPRLQPEPGCAPARRRWSPLAHRLIRHGGGRRGPPVPPREAGGYLGRCRLAVYRAEGQACGLHGPDHRGVLPVHPAAAPGTAGRGQ